MAWGFWKVEFRRVGCWSLEEFWGRNRREFWKVEVMGSVLGFEELRGGLGLEVAAEWRAVTVADWADLGTKIGGGLKGVGCSGWDENEGGRRLDFSGRGGDSGWLSGL